MRVKVGDCWFEPTIGAPIMVEFTADEAARVLQDPSRPRLGGFEEGCPIVNGNEFQRFLNEGACDPASNFWMLMIPRPRHVTPADEKASFQKVQSGK